MVEMQKIAPTMMFLGEAEEAIAFYVKLFDDSRVDRLERYGDRYAGPEGQVVHAEFRLKGQRFIAMDNAGQQAYEFTPAISFFVTCADEAEIDRLAAALGENGMFHMPLDTYPFARKYCWVEDRFGVSWQLLLE